MEPSRYEVVIAGAGPTGLMLAAELKLGGVNVVIVERRPDQHLDESRAKGIHSRAIEVLDQRGIAERFIAAGQRYPKVGFGGVSLDISDFPTRHNYLLGLSQSKFEPILAEWTAELGVPILRKREVKTFSQSVDGVTIELSDGHVLHADYFVGCDGGRSIVRKLAGIDFPGLDATVSYIIAEVRMDEEPVFGVRREGGGIGKAPDGVSIGVVVREEAVKHGDNPTIQELRDALIATYGTDFGLRSINWISRFSDATRQAATYRKGRILLAGDAAHVHPPQGGQGLGTGIQDVVNLGWKLAQVVHGVSPDTLLDTYHAERHPVGARVLQNTRAQIVLSKPDGQHVALREIVSELLTTDEARKRIVGMLSGLDIRYDPGEGHPLVGRRMPDLDLWINGVTTRVYTLLHDAKPVLLNLHSSMEIAHQLKYVRCVIATYDGEWELPVAGNVSAPSAVLIRPDGYVAWAGNIDDSDLPNLLRTWFGEIM